MCGIAGIVTRRSTLDLERAIAEMTYRVRHRGPDDEGCYVAERVALGHRRLSIIDLSASGHQPMTSPDGRYVITFNGEIYNYLELKPELQAGGFQFRSNTDTEVIIAAFAAWGVDCLSRFNGMWSFAIYDTKHGTIFAARDRFGVKPFYYTLNETCFAFGSEIRQLLPLLPSVSAKPAVVSEFLLTGVQVPSTQTFFEGVSSLCPGHYLLYDTETDRCVIRRYYSLSERLNGVDDHANPDAIEDFRHIFDDAVRLRLRSDVRVGTCLSGGLDSSSVALVAAPMYRSNSNHPFSAITAISEDPRNSEEAYAEEVVKAGSLHWIRVRPGYDDFRGLLSHVIKSQEEPFNSPSICMQAFVMQAAKDNGIVVLLDGQGGDETLLGYDRYYSAHYVALWREGGARKVLQGLRHVTESNANMQLGRLTAYLILGLVPTARYLYYLKRSSYLRSYPPLPEWMSCFARACLDVRSLQILEVESTGLPALLRYEDKNSMAYSVEARLPFLDYRLVELCVSLAPSLKIQDGWTKWALRKAMSDVLPHGIAWRRNKIGFAAPDDFWLARHLEIMVETVKHSPIIRRFCDLGPLLRRYRGLDRNSQWRLYSLALWEEQFGVQS
jgi:asparagine synthase (glutamine-hydrolysing)